jgi:hypothetical protein
MVTNLFVVQLGTMLLNAARVALSAAEPGRGKAHKKAASSALQNVTKSLEIIA